MPKLVAVQALRGLAALAIALFHLESEGRLAGAGPEAGRRFFPLDAGVDVFFVISGFVMVYASTSLFGRPGAARIFLARRFARIAPLYWLTTTIFLAVALLRPDWLKNAVTDPAYLVASYLFIPWARPDGVAQPAYTLGWTLNYEMFFYVLFALALGFSRRKAVLAVSVALVALISLGLLFKPLPQPFGFWTGTIQLEFVIGMALGFARVEGATLALPARVALAAIGLGLFWVVGGDVVPQTADARALLFGPPAACLVAACGFAPGSERDGAPWLTRIAEAIGDASYAIYLLHPFVIRGTTRLLDATEIAPILGPIGMTAVLLAATILIGLVSYHAVERPLTQLGRRLLEPRPTVRAPL